MQRYDRYVLRNYLAWWAVIAFGLLALFSSLEMLGHADEYGQAARFGVDSADVARFALMSLPFLLVQLGPYVTLLAALGTVTSFLRNHEWIPALVAGRSAWRAFLPMFVAAFAIAFALGQLRELGFPRLRSAHESLRLPLLEQRPWKPTDLWVRAPGGFRLHAAEFVPAASGGPRIHEFQVFLPGAERERLVRADAATWTGDAWELENGRLVDGGGESPLRLFSREGLAPADCERAWFARVRPLDLTVADCRALLAADPGHRQAATLAWSWRAALWAPLVLLALGLPFALRFERRSSLEGLASGLGLCALAFVVELVLRDFATRGALSPWLAGLGPLGLFGGLGMAASARMRT